MAKIQTAQWIGLVPFAILIALLALIWWKTGFNDVLFYLLALACVTAMYFLTHLFSYNLFEIGEKKLPNDEKILMLEKEEASLLWMYVSGAGFTFLIGGIPIFSTNPFFAIIGIVFLTIGNLIHSIFYYPRYRLLYRRRLNEITLKKKNV